MRSDSHGGTRPPCKGKSANPDRFISTLFYSPDTKVHSATGAPQRSRRGSQSKQFEGLSQFQGSPRKSPQKALDTYSIFPVLSKHADRLSSANRPLRRYVLRPGHGSAPPHHAAFDDR